MASASITICFILYCTSVMFKPIFAEDYEPGMSRPNVQCTTVTTTKTCAPCSGSNSGSYLCETKNMFNPKYSISLKKSGAQSKTHPQSYDGNKADNALDGNRSPRGPFAHGDTEPLPWWRVDLGAEFHVQGMGIVTRDEIGFEHRLHDFEVRVGNFDPVNNPKDTRITQNQLCHHFAGHGMHNGQTYTLTCTHGLIGRYVSIQIIRYCNDGCNESETERKYANLLILAEVDVYGCKNVA